MSKAIDKGMSMLNATDETANPYGLILSKIERETIYGDLTRIDYTTNVLLYGKMVETASTGGNICAVGIGRG